MRPCWHLIPGSVSLSRSAWGDSVQTNWLVGRHIDPFTLDNTVLCCVTVAPLGMFLLAFLFDTYPLIFESHAAWSQFLEICFVIGWRYYWAFHLGKICNIFFYCPHRCEKCYASTGLHALNFLLQSLVSVSKARMYARKFLLRECIPVLQFSFKSNAGYLRMPCYSLTLSSFVRLPDEFYVTTFNVAVVSYSSHKYAVGYSLLCSCCWQLDFCVK